MTLTKDKDFDPNFCLSSFWPEKMANVSKYYVVFAKSSCATLIGSFVRPSVKTNNIYNTLQKVKTHLSVILKSQSQSKSWSQSIKLI